MLQHDFNNVQSSVNIINCIHELYSSNTHTHIYTNIYEKKVVTVRVSKKLIGNLNS